VTSLYTEANRDLVRAVRQAEELAQPVVRIPSFFLSFGKVIMFFLLKKRLYALKIMAEQERAFSRKRSFRNKLKKQALQKCEASVAY
jgi:hypothetical protein